MTAKPKKKKPRGGILIIMSRNDMYDALLGNVLALFAGEDEDDEQWSSGVKNLYDVIMTASETLRENDLSESEICNLCDSIDFAYASL